MLYDEFVSTYSSNAEVRLFPATLLLGEIEGVFRYSLKPEMKSFYEQIESIEPFDKVANFPKANFIPYLQSVPNRSIEVAEQYVFHGMNPKSYQKLSNSLGNINIEFVFANVEKPLDHLGLLDYHFSNSKGWDSENVNAVIENNPNLANPIGEWFAKKVKNLKRLECVEALSQLKVPTDNSLKVVLKKFSVNKTIKDLHPYTITINEINSEDDALIFYSNLFHFGKVEKPLVKELFEKFPFLQKVGFVAPLMDRNKEGSHKWVWELFDNEFIMQCFERIYQTQDNKKLLTIASTRAEWGENELTGFLIDYIISLGKDKVHKLATTSKEAVLGARLFNDANLFAPKVKSKNGSQIITKMILNL